MLFITDGGKTLRTTVSGIRETGRVAQGVRLMHVAEGERLVAVEAYAEAEGESANGRNGAASDPAPESDDDAEMPEKAPVETASEPPAAEEPEDSD